MLRREAAARGRVRAHHAALLRGANRFHTFAVSLVAGGGRVNLQGARTRDMDEIVVLVSLGLFTKACWQHRSGQLLARAGLGADAIALTRCLFETTLALAFVLRRRLRLRRGRDRRPLPPVPGWPLNSRLRARLYLANIAFENDRVFREFQDIRGLRRFRRRAAAARSVVQQVRDGEAAIGPEWTRRLRDSRSFSGVSIKDLALSLRLAAAYATLYRYGSWSVHAIDLTHFITLPDPGRPPLIQLAPHEGDVASAVSVANNLLLVCVRFVNERFGLDRDRAIERHAYRLSLLDARG